MAIYEVGEKPPLQGVSQQIARARQPGQCRLQENMLSDPVTHPRRRPGSAYAFDLAVPGASTNKVLGWYVDVAGVNVHIILNMATGIISLFDDAYTALATLDAGAYLTSTDRSSIRLAVVGDEVFLLNTAVQPAEVAATGITNPDSQGMFYVTAGMFNTKYEVVVSTSTASISASYTTPSGAGAGDAALTTPAHIATQLRNALDTAKATAGISAVSVREAYVYLVANAGVTGVKVTSSTGLTLLTPSRDSYMTSESQLPAQLPAAANGYIIRVGDVRKPVYYKYQESTQSWLETGAYGSPASLSGMPVSIRKTAGVWNLNTTAYEGRLAGDTTTNPAPRFLTYGITGLASYQGRLVLLSGAQVMLSASLNPRRFYRSSVVSLLDADAIQIGSNANSSAAYAYAVQFQKDLLLFSSKYQALIPSANTAITPRTATVVVTSTYGADMTSAPVPIGRTVLYPAPRSEDYFGVMEMVPSANTDSQYVSLDATPHLPQYMLGRCRFGVSSTTSNMAVLASSVDAKVLYVHEYQWEGDQKVQQAWHTWKFQYDVAFVYFTGDTMHIGFVQNGTLVVCTLDPRVGGVPELSTRLPYLDMYAPGSITAHNLPLPAWLTTFDPAVESVARAVLRGGALNGELVGSTPGTNALTTVQSHPSGNVYFGIPFTSKFGPAQPMHRDRNGNPVGTGKTTLQKYKVTTVNSAEYSIGLADRSSTISESYLSSTLHWDSGELLLDAPQVAKQSVAVLPCRTHAESTEITLETNGVGDMNVISLDYILRHDAKISRRDIA